ncbi:GntR family transcriptional regulator [Agrococcus jejuensis]|uniref:GntR family transcriptional regulator n=1 Tax=Agrococcus jejuensis TaxID=399736 RepID=UPI0011A76D5C|nr:GntR family transcriptional regulator [Agrococcus jejuensis]
MVEKLDRESATPLYIQLADVIRAKIQRGDWQPDQRIPSENELNQLYGISRMTARQVLARLVDEGLLFRVQGKGTFVSRSKISTRSPSYQGIREQLEQQGYATDTELLGQRLEPASTRVAQALDIPTGTPTFIVRRLRRVDGTPISVHESHVPEALAPGVIERDLVAEQLCTVLDRDFGLRMTKVLETLETTAASANDAKLLAVHEGTPILQLEQRISSPSSKPFEFTRIRFRGDMVRLEFTYDV